MGNLVQHDPQRGRIVRRAKPTGGDGMTIREIMNTNRMVMRPLVNMHTLKIVSREKGYLRITNKRLGFDKARVPVIRYVIQDSERTTPRSPIRKHPVKLFRLDGQADKLSDRGVKVVVTCDCEFFMYNSEYALARHKAGFIFHCNGQPPMVTNSGFIPFSCKHIELAMRDVIKRGL